MNRERRPYYLGGPNGVDWILPNHAKGRRENRMYVDYVQDITVENGEHDWVSPLPDSLYREYKDATPPCLVVTRAGFRMHANGLVTRRVLRILAPDHGGSSIRGPAALEL